LINVDFVMPKGSNHIGIEMNGGSSGGGSGLFMGDLNFTGGRIGLLFNNQQYSIRGCKFTDVGTAISFDHAFVVTLQQIECVNVKICVNLGGAGAIGSLNMIDSSCDRCGTVVNGSSSIVLENIAVTNSGPTLTVDGMPRNIGDLAGKTYASGHILRSPSGGSNATTNSSASTSSGRRTRRPSGGFNSTSSGGLNSTNTSTNSSTADSFDGATLRYTERGSLTDSTGQYFTKRQPQYENYPVSAFVSVKSAGVKGMIQVHVRAQA
jgi:glucan 1,3-beta-glucosidase